MLVMSSGEMDDVCELVLWELFVLYEVLNHNIRVNSARATWERDCYLSASMLYEFCYGWHVYHTDTVSVCFWECLYTSVCVCLSADIH